LGQGDGTFRPQSAQQSGIAIYGEQRGAAVADFDADGRVDLAVAEMDASARLYRNSTARAGVRVRLRGKPQNQLAIGAQLRTRFGDAWGPAREIHAGSGYWSQDSVIQVMARPEGVSKVQIRWPDGKVTESQVGLGATEVVLDAP
jgi:hypothetical protein